MYQKAQSMYFGLSIVVLGTALFVMQPSSRPEIATLQTDVANQFSIAWQQTIGDQPWFTEATQIYEGVSNFYDQSAAITIALLDQPEADEDVIYVFSQVYQTFASVIHEGGTNSSAIAYNEVQLPTIGADFMTEEPLYNLIPDHSSVAGVSIGQSNPVNSTEMPWVTIADNTTGQLYCLAVYNGTVNKYLGPCEYDGYY